MASGVGVALHIVTELVQRSYPGVVLCERLLEQLPLALLVQQAADGALQPQRRRQLLALLLLQQTTHVTMSVLYTDSRGRPP